ncbi:MAG: bifunctional diaminohydroxyphosphoribosylaminopyrimidine deaminase/5-amino-6-(5-phosphoribosylamino)uracil reductase RibD [Candidatus Hydrogenedentes bacterium]|nr:bifunctional diaminohydroxyphosphoribosylaminopyrimidine deaminase/5-amino-6-(5-phosphoribosylamino)uracil reductase RibD [Candidatus Hydrogenedentota bacterium]
MPTDRDYMERALALAERGRGRTSPNPMVGCVVVRDGAVIGEGCHERAGDAHAEVNALRDAGDVTDATVYVTLEPCCHEGKTPPCVDLLKARKPARVIAAMEDPNPQVSGRGIEALRGAGVSVELGLMEDEARRLNEVFIKYVTTGTPFVIAKCGMSLDGKIATRTGDSQWVTGEASRHLVHQLRNEVDAILVGSRTVMLDDPSLTTRLRDEKTRDPIRVILDAGEYLDGNRRVFQLASEAPTWVATPDGGVCEAADAVLHIPGDDDAIDMQALMKELASREVTSVLIEGGGTTHASAFEAGIVDKVMFFVAPKIIGGREAVSAVEGLGIEQMSDAIMLKDMTATPLGHDILIVAYVVKD